MSTGSIRRPRETSSLVHGAGFPEELSAQPCVVDWDRDGRLDLIATTFRTQEGGKPGAIDISWHRNLAKKGPPTLASPVLLATIPASECDGVDAADWDHDGWPDLIVGFHRGEYDKARRTFETSGVHIYHRARPIEVQREFFRVGACAFPEFIPWRQAADRQGTSGDDVLDDLPLHVSQPHRAACVAIRQPLVVQTQQMQDRRMPIMHMHRVFNSFIPVVVGAAIREPPLDAAAGHPEGIAFVIVVAAVAVLGVRRAPNSPPQITSVSFKSPRAFRSVSKPAIGLSTAGRAGHDLPSSCGAGPSCRG